MCNSNRNILKVVCLSFVFVVLWRKNIEIHGTDFQYLYKKYGKKRELQAFELFIFFNGIHLIVYENGEWEIIRNEQNISIDKDSLYQSIIQDITVCNKTFKNQETFKE